MSPSNVPSDLPESQVKELKPCLCGGKSERFPDSDRPCVCYSDRNPDCRCYVNPGGHDGVMHAFDCPIHSKKGVAHA